MPRLPRILILGDAVAPTGYARVMHAVFTRLTAHYEIFQLATNYRGNSHDWPWRLFPADVTLSSYGADQVVPLVTSLEPDLIFAYHDLWVLADYMKALQQVENLKVILYGSVDSGPVDPDYLPALQGCACLATYTEFARQEFLLAQERKGGAPAFSSIEVMPLGVDVEAFHPLKQNREEAKLEARRRMYPDRPEMAEAFIVLNANRNQLRKRLDTTLLGFAIFAADKPPEVLLHLHLNVKDRGGWDVHRLARRLGIDDRLILTYACAGQPDLPDSELNLVYNAADVGLNTSSAEGWGLVSFEQAAAGVPQIVPGHTSGCGLWRDAAELLEPSISLINEGSITTAYLIAPTTVAASLDRVYASPELRRELGQRAFANAHRQSYCWDSIAASWNQLFRRVLGDALPRP